MNGIFELFDTYSSMPRDQLQTICDKLRIDAQNAERDHDDERALKCGLEYVAAHAALSAIASRQNDDIMALSAAQLAKQGMGVVIYKVDQLCVPNDEASREKLKKQLIEFDQTFFATSNESKAVPKKGCLSGFILLCIAASCCSTYLLIS